MKRRIMAIILTVMLMLGCASCSLFNLTNTKPSFRTYKEIEEFYSDRDEIEPAVSGDHRVFQKTVGGLLHALDKKDKKTFKNLCCKYLLDMEDTDDLIDDLFDGFRGKIKDTSPMDGDFQARETALFSKDEPSAYYSDCFYIYTSEQTYELRIGMYSVHENVDDGEDFIGITNIQLLTLDRAYGLKRLADTLDDNLYLDHYTFADGNEMDVMKDRDCFIATSFGDSEGFIVAGFESNHIRKIYKLMDDPDTISLSKFRKIDFEDADEVEEFIESNQPYAINDETGLTYYIYNLKGDDGKIYFYTNDKGAMSYCRVMDDGLIMSKDSEVIYDISTK